MNGLDRDVHVFRLWFGGMTDKQIAESIGVSTARINQIRNRAMRINKRALTGDDPTFYNQRVWTCSSSPEDVFAETEVTAGVLYEETADEFLMSIVPTQRRCHVYRK